MDYHGFNHGCHPPGCVTNAINEFPLAEDCCQHQPRPPHHHGCEPCGDATVVPPPIPPVRYIPGMNVQEQLCNMAERVNISIDRWNHIQADCYKALDQVVGAAVNNDVYYAPGEVTYNEGYSEEDSCKYTVVTARPVDRAGRPIFCHLRPAYNNTTNSGAREQITQASFVTSAHVAITAAQATESFWAGPSVFNGNPGAGSPDDTVWVFGFTRNGVLRFFRGDVGLDTLRQNRMVNCIGPVFPILKDGELFNEVLGSMGEEKGSIQAIGWKKMNGCKVFFSCGCYDQPGMSPVAVAKILQGMGCTNAVITSYQTAPVGMYDATPIGAGTQNLSGTNPGNSGAVEVPGMTGGMTYLGKITDAPIQWSIPSNVAVWYISKRPPKGWCNAFTTEVADVVQKLGNMDNSLSSIMGQINGGNQDIAELKNQVQKNANDIAKVSEIVNTFDDRLSDVEESTTSLGADVATLKTKVSTLETGLANEISERKSADAALDAKIAAETSQRVSEDAQIRAGLAQEEAERTAADAALKAELTQEAQTRADADRNLQAAIEAEQSARSTKDTQHEARMDAIEAQEQKDNEATNKRIDDLSAAISDGSALPIATPDSLGVIKVGPGLVIDEEGTLSATVQDREEYVGGFGITIKNYEVSINADEVAQIPAITDIQKNLERFERWNSSQDVNLQTLNEAITEIQKELDAKAPAYSAENGVYINGTAIGLEHPVVPITGAEYDALTEAEKNSDTVWLITDRSSFDPINSIKAGNGITITGDTISVTTPVIPVTQNEYNELTPEERDLGLYVIYDDETVRRIRNAQFRAVRNFGGNNVKN